MSGDLIFYLLAALTLLPAVWVVLSKNIVHAGFSLLFVYAMGIGVLFWVLAVFAASLPKSGQWMESVKSFGGGVEWAGPTWGSRNFPVRFGMRRSDLPFTFDGDNPSERVFSGGIGLNLVPRETGLVGAIDLAVEKGTREGGSLSESFWRMSVTFRVGSF